jgi:hypothetical protein
VTATRGVVHLFNAVAKAQRERRDAAASGARGAAAAAAPRTSFLSELRRVAASSADAPAPGGAAAGAPAVAPGWDVLREGFGMGRTGLKEWDKGGRAAAGGKASGGGKGGAAGPPRLEGGGLSDSDLGDA